MIPSDPKLLKISSLIFQEKILIHNTKQIGQQHQVNISLRKIQPIFFYQASNLMNLKPAHEPQIRTVELGSKLLFTYGLETSLKYYCTLKRRPIILNQM